ncbi:MAG: FtsX-like permease family protein [Deltaproteobacteria bacterium]|nr:FtsX-like permease family protein [Deltaproteobacteria bacterium]
MSLETFLARRYLSTHHKPLFVSILTWISLAGMAISVFALIFVIAVMQGFEKDFQERIVGFKAPLILTGKIDLDWKRLEEEIRGLDRRIQDVKLFVEGEAVLQTEMGGAAGVKVKGIRGLPSVGRRGHLETTEPLNPKEILVGRELALSWGIDPDLDESVRLVFPLGEVGPTGELLPTSRTFTVMGRFWSGFYEYDNKYVLMTYEDALNLLGDHARTGLEIWPVSIDFVDSIRDRLKTSRIEEIQDTSLTTWRDQNPKLFAALKLERYGMLFLLVILLFIASCTVFGLISLTVMEKIQDMAVLRTLGLSANRVRRIFLLKAASLGLLGDLIGGFFGITAVILLIRYPFRLPTTYYVDYLPVILDWGSILFVMALAPFLSIVAALYPASQAVKGSPIEVIRYE